MRVGLGSSLLCGIGGRIANIVYMILLHACCAPCAGAVIEKLLADGEQFAVFFSNSNIYPRAEYDLRLEEIRRYCSSLGVSLIEDEYNHEDWLRAVRGLENEPERGGRCSACFRYRLLRAAKYANGMLLSEYTADMNRVATTGESAATRYQLLTTTLASSRWKNLEQVNSAGQSACEEAAVICSADAGAKLVSAGTDAARETSAMVAAAADLVADAEGAAVNSSVMVDAGNASAAGVCQYWPANWRKGGLQERRNAIIKEQGFYNQNWCGCEFSKR